MIAAELVGIGDNDREGVFAEGLMLNQLAPIGCTSKGDYGDVVWKRRPPHDVDEGEGIPLAVDEEEMRGGVGLTDDERPSADAGWLITPRGFVAGVAPGSGE